MATRFAIGTGNWSNTAIWDNGALPLSTDDIFANGFTITLDQDITVGSLRNTVSNVYLPDMPIPLMTGNTQPSGVAFAGQNTSDAYKAFDYTNGTFWSSGNSLTDNYVGYQFPVGKIIKRYYFFRSNTNQSPQSWVFEGSNDGITYDALETVTANVAYTPYTSVILSNTTSYIYYRLRITAVKTGTLSYLYNLEMTENVGTVYGTTTGGKYVVPNTLSGSRNIVQTGDGIICNNVAFNTVVETNNTTGNTVNFNISGNGLIVNQLSQTAFNNIAIINILGNGTVNFNSDIYGSQSTLLPSNALGTICINANATVNVNGNVYLAKSSTSFYYTIHLQATTSNSAILNINGNVIGTNFSSQSAILLSSTATINVTGNLISDVSPCIVTPVSNAFIGGAGNINLVGTATLTNINSQPCIITRNTLVTITGNVVNKGDTSAIWGNKVRWTNIGVPYWIFQDTTGADIALSSGTISGSYPNESDVRLGVTYATGPVKTGTCAVPLPQYVSQGVPVDATVGTGYINPVEVWNILTSTITTNSSIGERLKVASTVETTGDQLASYTS
jgi:hypothetical protein